jgi:hypothetical protein
LLAAYIATFAVFMPFFLEAPLPQCIINRGNYLQGGLITCRVVHVPEELLGSIFVAGFFRSPKSIVFLTSFRSYGADTGKRAIKNKLDSYLH